VNIRCLLLAGLLAMIGSGCSRHHETDPVVNGELLVRSTVPDPAAQACAECHAEIVQAWVGSQHANANRLVSDARDLRAFEPSTTIAHGSYTTRISRTRAGGYIFAQSFSNHAPVTYRAEAAIGDTPLIQYLVTFPGGRLQAFDVAYDPRSNEWFDVFGTDNRQPHEWGHWKNRGMNWNVQCAFCHMTGFKKNYDIEADEYRSTWRAMGISCAQCHPVRPDGAKTSAVDTNACPMLEPPGRDIATNRVMDNCASCHARREEFFGTFQPGDRFDDYFRLTLPDAPGVFHHDGQILDEDFEYASFRMSRMGHKGVTCLDCHEPHSGRTILPVENNALCLRCHTPPGLNGAVPVDPVAHSFHPPGTIGSRCVDCHMPVHYYMVRDGRRDHAFTSPDPRLTIEHGIPNACNMCHADQSAEWAESFVNQWYGDKMNRRARDRARAVARAHAGDPAVVSNLLGMASSEEIAAWRAALNGLLTAWALYPEVTAHLRGDLTHADPLVRSAAVRALQDHPAAPDWLMPAVADDAAVVRVDAAWAVSPSRPLPPPRLQEVTAYLNNISDQPPGALRQAAFAMRRGAPAEAEPWAAKAAAWDPSPVAFNALGARPACRGQCARRRFQSGARGANGGGPRRPEL
jgi:predicted CXXCH cytochrome family protein